MFRPESEKNLGKTKNFGRTYRFSLKASVLARS